MFVLINAIIFGEQSDSHNLKYLGIDALGRLIKLSPEIAEQHQLAVIDCLEVKNITGMICMALLCDGYVALTTYLFYVFICHFQ